MSLVFPIYEFHHQAGICTFEDSTYFPHIGCIKGMLTTSIERHFGFVSERVPAVKSFISQCVSNLGNA